MYLRFPLSSRALEFLPWRLWPVAHPSSPRTLHPCQKLWAMLPCRSTRIIPVNSPTPSIACSRIKRYRKSYVRKALHEHNSSPGPKRPARCWPCTSSSTKEVNYSLIKRSGQSSLHFAVGPDTRKGCHYISGFSYRGGYL